MTSNHESTDDTGVTGMTELRGRTVVITGASAGIGAAAARRLGELGATVAVVGRSPEKTAAVAKQVGGQAHTVDYGRLADVRRLATELLDTYERIDVLANNAGAAFTKPTTSADGHEMTFQVNHLAPFLLTNLLLARLTASAARVINTGSASHRGGRLDLDNLGGSDRRAYQTAKLATILFTRELARRTGVVTVAFHPGVVATEFGRDIPVAGRIMGSWLGRVLLTSPEKGAQPLVHLATVDDLVNGAYFDRFKVEDPKNPQARDADLARELWERSADMTGAG
nr:short-chain dehydrogenase/reductase SDR [uncultured bacterium]